MKPKKYLEIEKEQSNTICSVCENRALLGYYSAIRLRNNAEERSSRVRRGGGLQSTQGVLTRREQSKAEQSRREVEKIWLKVTVAVKSPRSRTLVTS